MRKLNAGDRSALIKLASSLPVGSPERRAILAGLESEIKKDADPKSHDQNKPETFYEKKAAGAVNVPGKHILDRAKVDDNAHVWGNAEVSDRAYVSGKASVSGNAKVYGDAMVSGNAIVGGNANIGGDAVILGGKWDGSEGPITSGKWKAPGIPA